MIDKRHNSLKINIMRVLSANFLVVITGFLGGFVFPRILSLDAYALYNTFVLYVGYITILHLGFPDGMVINYAGKDFNSIDKRQYKSEVLILTFILSFFTILFYVVSKLFSNEMIYYVTLAIIPVGVISSYKVLLQSWNRFKEFSRISTLITVLIPFLALLYFVLFKELSGNTYIHIYLLVYWLIAIYVIVENSRKIKSVKSNKLFTKENWQTEKNGAAMMLGNYVNTLLLSADKQFVRWFFGNTEFAFYSFGMSMYSLMMVFITSIAQPLFPSMAQGKFQDEEYNKIKDILLIFGSFLSCAYFPASVIVKLFIPKYVRSLEVIKIYFVVFPAMAVINCLYINLYKVKGLMKNYITTLVVILGVAIILNEIFIFLMDNYTGVAIATVITYYIWFCIGIKQFKFLKLTIKDKVFLGFSMGVFFIITKWLNDYMGFVLYLTLWIFLVLICFGKEMIKILTKKLVYKNI